jgi:hypothetical protein
MNLGGMPKVAQPKMPDPVRIPSPDDPDLLEARRRRMQDEMANRQGRQSTQLSGDGGSRPTYSRTTLG